MLFSTLALISPMILVLLSLAFLPLILPKFWEKYEIRLLSTISLLSFIADLTYIPHPSRLINHAVLQDYLPFIIMLFTLYTLSNGINIKIDAKPSTLGNIIFLVIGGAMSSLIGTTGSAMLLIKPFLVFNRKRKVKQHLIIFFIIIIANIGGLLTPLGDPPLLLGYLNGIDFAWLLKHMYKYWFFYILLCLSIFYVIDTIVLSKDKNAREEIKSNNTAVSISIDGILNIILLILTALILFVNLNLKINIGGIEVSSIYIKDSILLLFSGLSLRLHNKNIEEINFKPFIEVARTFLVIFIVLAPVLYVMRHNSDSIHKFLDSISNDGKNIPTAYFLLCSVASAFLDNAPSYLLFFKMSGCTAKELMTTNAQILTAISVSSVVMGSLSYIGNAPNMMIKNIAVNNKIKMPSFVAYCLYSSLIIIPISYILIKIFNFH